MIARDKLLHVAAGVIVALAVVVIVTLWQAFGIGVASFAAVCGVAAAKEAQDELLGTGTGEWGDFLATIVAGGAASLVLHALHG